MADEPEILSVGVESDGSIETVTDSAAKSMEDLASAATASFGAADTAAATFADTLKTISASIADASTELDELIDKAKGVADLTVPINPDYYGAKGGGIGPAPEDDGSGGGGGVGSLFGIGHSLTAAGRTLGAPGLTEAGGFVYIQQGIQRITDLLPELNSALESTPNLLTTAATGLTDFGIPVTTLGLTAGIAIPAVVGLGIAIANFNQIVEDGTKAVNDDVAAQEKYFEFQTTATTEAAQQRLAKDQDAQKAQQAEVDQVKKNIISQIQQNEPNYLKAHADRVQQSFTDFKTPDVNLALGEALDPLYANLKKLTEAAGAAQTDIGALSNDIKDGAFSANDAAEAARKLADTHVQIAARYAADDDLTKEAAQKRIDILTADIAAQKDAVSTLEAANQATGLSSQEHLQNTEAIKQHTQTMQDEQAEIQHLTDVSLHLITVREAEADQVKTIADLIKLNADFAAADATRIANFQAQQAQQKADFDAKQSQELADYNTAQAEKAAAFGLANNEAETKREADRLKEQQSYATASARAQEDYEQKLADIQTKSKSQLLKDAANLDANAVENDLQAKNDQVKNLTDSYNKEQSRRQEDEQTKLQQIDTNAAAEAAKRLAQYQLQQSNADINFNQKQANEQAQFAQQQKNEQDNFTRSEAQQKASFDRQQTALQDKLKADEAAINSHNVIQTAQVTSGLYDARAALANGLTNITNDAIAWATTVGNQVAAALSTSYGPPAALAAPVSAPIGVNDPALAAAAAESGFGGSGSIIGNGGAPAPYDPNYINQGFQFSDSSNTSPIFGPAASGAGTFYSTPGAGGSALGLNGLGGGYYGGFADGGYIPPGGHGYAGETGIEGVRALAGGGVQITPSSQTNGGGKHVTINGNVNLNGKPAPAELKSQVYQFMDNYFEDDQ